MNLKLLEKEFTGIGEVKGFNFTQVYSSEFAYIYKVEGDSTNYEVFERKNTPVGIDFKNHIYSKTEFSETYPKSNSFGKWAWTFKNMYDAGDKAEEIYCCLLEKKLKINKNE